MKEFLDTAINIILTYLPTMVAIGGSIIATLKTIANVKAQLHANDTQIMALIKQNKRLITQNEEIKAELTELKDHRYKIIKK